jgi:anti-sigma factor RsiW
VTETEACRRIEPLLSAWIDGELGAVETGRIAAHVDSCPRCAGTAEQLSAVRSLLRSLPVRRLPEAVQGPLTPSVGASGSPNAPSRERADRDPRPVPRAGAMLAVAAGLLGGAVFALGGQPPPDTRVVSVPLDVYVADHVIHTVHGPVTSPVTVGLRR